jgi:hypothetical protein
VLSRVRTLALDQLASFYSFQRHRRNSLPKILQGEPHTSPSTQEVTTQGLEARSSSGQDTQEDPKKTEVLTQKVDIALSNPPGNQAKAQFEALIKKGTGYITVHTK